MNGSRRTKKQLLAILVCSVLFAVRPGWADADNRPGMEPIESLIQNSLSYNPKVFAKNQAVSAYLYAFLPPWKQLLTQLFSQDATESHLESFFGQNYELLKQALPAFQKLKPPSEFKDFQEIFSKGLEELSDWSVDMRDRIHYAKTPYQKEANMKRIEGFQHEWYDTFFGDSLNELNNSLSIFLTSHWMDELNPNQINALNKNPELKRYLVSYHRITRGHLKAVKELSKKVREDRDKYNGDDPVLYAEHMQKELDDLKGTLAGLKKLVPPESFKEFHAAEVSWIDFKARATQKLLELADANQKHLSDDRIQTLMFQKNQFEQEANQEKASADKAYYASLNSIAELSGAMLHSSEVPPSR